MNERIKQLAEQAFMVCLKGADEEHLEQLERFAELVRQDEREACAKLCDDASLYFIDQGMNAVDGADYCANEIRGRDMSTKEQNIDTSEECVHETDKSIHEDDDIQEYKRPWVGLSDDEVHKIIDDCTSDEAELEELIDFSIAILAVEAKLKEKNT